MFEAALKAHGELQHRRLRELLALEYPHVGEFQPDAESPAYEFYGCPKCPECMYPNDVATNNFDVTLHGYDEGEFYFMTLRFLVGTCPNMHDFVLDDEVVTL